MGRAFLALISVLAISACNNTETEKGTGANSVRVEKKQFVNSELRWFRPGPWMAAENVSASQAGPVSLVSRDQYGSRMILALKPSGYEIHQIEIDCVSENILYMGGMRSEKDDVNPSEKITNPTSVISKDALKRVCLDRFDRDSLDPIEAVIELRKTQQPRSLPDQKTLDEMRRKFEAENYPN